jgi:hypothetical protein
MGASLIRGIVDAVEMDGKDVYLKRAAVPRP